MGKSPSGQPAWPQDMEPPFPWVVTAVLTYVYITQAIMSETWIAARARSIKIARRNSQTED